MITDVKATRSIDKSHYIQPSKPAVFGQDGWVTIESGEPALLDNADDTYSFIYGIALIVVLIGIIAYVVLGIVL